MPIGVTLLQLRRDLRAETGQSLNPAQNTQSQATQDVLLDRQQRELWDAYEWPHLRFFVDVPLADQQALYSYPAEMPFDQISRIFIAEVTTTQDNSGATPVVRGADWVPLTYGIRAFDTRYGTVTQAGMPRSWGNKVTVTAGSTNVQGQIQLLPMPSIPPEQDTPPGVWPKITHGKVIRLEGQAPCNSLVADTDKCLLDSKAIVLFCAAEILATQKSEGAPIKLTKAQQYLRRLLQNSGADKRPSFTMGGSYRVDHLAPRPWAASQGYRPGIDYIAS